MKRLSCLLLSFIGIIDGYIVLPGRRSSSILSGVSRQPYSSNCRSLRTHLGATADFDAHESCDNDPLNNRKKIELARGLPDQKPKKGGGGLGGYDPYEDLRGSEIDVGDPQIKLKEKERSVTSILAELAAIQQQGPQKYCILGTRHCSYLHQQIIELLAYALVLSGNHVYTSGAGGTNAATIKGALRAERPDLLTVVIPQSMSRQTKESQELLKEVEDVIAMPQNDDLSLDVASKICNSYLLSLTDQLISFAFHESNTVIEATKEAKKLNKPLISFVNTATFFDTSDQFTGKMHPYKIKTFG